MKKIFAFLTALAYPFLILGAEEALSSEEPMTSVMPSYQDAFMKMVLSVVALLVLVALTVWIFRRINQGRWGVLGSHRSIQILERKPLSQKSMLYLIEVEGTKFLIAESQLEVRHLGSLKPDLENPL